MESSSLIFYDLENSIQNVEKEKGLHEEFEENIEEPILKIFTDKEIYKYIVFFFVIFIVIYTSIFNQEILNISSKGYNPSIYGALSNKFSINKKLSHKKEKIMFGQCFKQCESNSINILHKKYFDNNNEINRSICINLCAYRNIIEIWIVYVLISILIVVGFIMYLKQNKILT